MDLRYKLSPEQRETAAHLFNYQPFILSDEIQTGAGYSWSVTDFSGLNFVCRKSECTEEQWLAFTSCAKLQRDMYDGWLAAIAERFPGGSLLDFATMNSYFPVKAQLLGMGRTTGADGFCDSARTDFLNQVLGTNAEFIQARYDPVTHSAPVAGSWDVVCASAIMTHLPDPLNFLTFLASKAKKALFIFDRVIDTDVPLIRLAKPRPEFTQGDPFPYKFNWGTHLSRGLLEHAFAELGFDEVIEFPGDYGWLPPADSPTPAYIQPAHQAIYRLGEEILITGSKHLAVLGVRRDAK